MAMPTVAAAAALHPAVASPSSTRRVGVGNGNSSAAAGAGFLAGGRRGGAAGAVRARVAEAAPVAAEVNRKESPAAPMVEIPVTCYQILGITEKAEKDEIVKAAMELKNAEIEDGYTAEVSTCRQALLVDVRDKLLFEQEYVGSIKEKVPPRSSLHIPWSWLPAALCVLQEDYGVEWRSIRTWIDFFFIGKETLAPAKRHDSSLPSRYPDCFTVLSKRHHLVK